MPDSVALGYIAGVLWTGFCAGIFILYQGWKCDRDLAAKDKKCRECPLREKGDL
jgi:hypothetical protein